MTAADSQNLIKQILKELNLDEKRFQPAGIASRISNAKNQLQSVSDFSKAASDFYNQKVAEIYERYQNKLLVNNAVVLTICWYCRYGCCRKAKKCAPSIRSVLIICW